VRRWRPLAAVLLAAVVALSATAPARAADQGIQLVSSQQLDSRLTDLTLSTPALKQPTHVRVLLPAGYDGSLERYPVLLLAARPAAGPAVDRLDAAAGLALVVRPGTGNWLTGQLRCAR
jgi:hypothetical protein